jgi:hypothetical protein
MPIQSRATPVAGTSRALVDEFLESYVIWRESCEDVSAAYERWASCGTEDRGAAFERYHAALDWEELAAHVHASRAAAIQLNRLRPTPAR